MRRSRQAGLIVGLGLLTVPWLPNATDNVAGLRSFSQTARADECPPAVLPDPDQLALSAGVFQISQFSNLIYMAGFSGQADSTGVWPAEMGWQGDRIDIQFTAPASVPAGSLYYQFRMNITDRYVQEFDMAVQAGPDLSHLVQAHVEHVDSPRQLVAQIPVCRLSPGQPNWIRIQGIGVQVGYGQPSGVKWNWWTLSLIRSATADEIRLDQLAKFTQYILDAVQPNGLVRDSLTLSPFDAPFHPATPDAAGFAILGLCAADRHGLTTGAASTVERILSAYAGQVAGVDPDRSADGHWVHFMNVADGTYAGCCWDRAYSPIGSALLVSAAQFARNHFAGNTAIASLADNLTASTNFNSAIHPAMDGRVFLSMLKAGGGDPSFGCVVPWNEYMLVVSLALREAENERALAVAPLWLNPDAASKIGYQGYELLTDHPWGYAPAFWTQQAHFFNKDFATNDAFETLLDNQRAADWLYCHNELGQAYRYGLTAGVSPGGYTADALYAHQWVFSPEAVMAWGDLATFLQFHRDQAPDDPRSRYGLTRVSSQEPSWVPYDAGLVDHLFLMFGLVESIDPLFFKSRLPGQPDADYDGIADRYDNCPAVPNALQENSSGGPFGDACNAPGDFDHNGRVDGADYVIFEACHSGPAVAASTGCQACDLDPDGDVDQDDFGLFQRSFTGPGQS